MTVRFRTIYHDKTREFAFDRKAISIGQAPFNDIALGECAIAGIHGQIEVHEEEMLVFRARASSMATRVFRAGECTQSSDGVEEQVFHIRPGDSIWLGDAPAVRVEVIGVELAARPTWSCHPVDAQAWSAMSKEAGQLFFRLSDSLSQAPDIEYFLRSAVYFLHQQHGVLPERVDLALPLGSAPWRAEDFRLDAISLAPSAPGEDEDGASKSPALDVRRIQGAFRRRRESLPIFRSHRADILDELKKRDRFVLLEHSGTPETEANVSTAQDAESEPDESSRYQVLIPCVLGDELAAVLSLYFLESPQSPDSGLSCEAIGGFIRQLQPISSMVLASYRTERRVEGVVEENRYWRERQRRHHFHKDFIAESDAAREVYEQVNHCVTHDDSVLLLGEAGSGKALIAQAIHHLSPRKDSMLTSINCRGLSGDDLDFELFGSADNKMTGDMEARTGIFELAEGGTVLLEEIDRLSLMLQGKILRMLRESEVRRTGETVGRRVNIRLVASTHCDLRQLVEAGQFRRDLYIVLSRNPLELPPLRRRIEDILPLARTFVSVYAGRYDRSCQRLSPDVQATLLAHSWQGNVRELKSVMESAVLKCDGEAIEIRHLGF